MTRREMIERGRRAVDAAYPDYTTSDTDSAVCDTLVDIMHYAGSEGLDVEKLVNSALGTHYMAERGYGLDEEPDA